jgi:hypothetical protein
MKRKRKKRNDMKKRNGTQKAKHSLRSTRRIGCVSDRKKREKNGNETSRSFDPSLAEGANGDTWI